MEQLPIQNEGTPEESYQLCACSSLTGCWVCFHCGIRFTNNEAGEAEAREHFGIDPNIDMPICRIAAGDGSLVATVRRLEAELARYQAEDTDLHREIHGLKAAHASALRRAEEEGYAKGLRDAGYSEAAP